MKKKNAARFNPRPAGGFRGYPYNITRSREKRMESLYNEEDARRFVEKYAGYPEELALRVYTSRLMGGDARLVLHGGGNTSVKLKQPTIFKEMADVIFIKASGHDMACIEPDGFTSLTLGPLRKLRRIESLSDEEMINQFSINRLSAGSPNPSVETLLHAFLPHKYVDHSHADDILILTHLQDGLSLLQEVLGPMAAVLPYAKSGLPLAKLVVEQVERRPNIDAVVISNHGIFTFAEDARTAYENMISYVNRAEVFIQEQLGVRAPIERPAPCATPKEIESMRIRCAQIIRGVCARQTADGGLQRVYVDMRTSHGMAAASYDEKVETICASGVLTPDHAVRTKNRMVYVDRLSESDEALWEIIQKSVNEFRRNYQRDIDVHGQGLHLGLDTFCFDPVLFMVAGLGLFAVGRSRKQARIAADIGERTVYAKLRAMAIGTYRSMDPSHVFEMEFWGLQRVKAESVDKSPLLGQVALVTGGGGVIGCGIADRLLAAGAAVVISDIDVRRLDTVYSILAEKYDKERIDRICFDVTDYSAVEKAFEEISVRFGGMDIIVPNAGIAHVAPIENLDPEKLDQVIAVNLKGTFTLIKAAIPILKRQRTGGNIIVISSKNVFDPGAAFGAYSASKAGAHQIAKIAALELAEIGIRVNMINPDAVFGDERVCSKLWEEVGPERMKSRGLDPEGLKEYYRGRSLLKVRVMPEHVGNAVVFFASNLTPTTGATLPVDAGNPATFSR